LVVPGRHAARDRNQPTGPLALGASRPPGRNLGLGWESLIPPGLNLGPVSVSRSSQSNGCARFSAEQNRLRLRRANPSLISLLRSLSRAAVSDTSGRRAAVERASLRRRPSPHRCSLAPTRWRASARRRRRSRRGASARSRARPHADERWSGSTRAARRSTTRVSVMDRSTYLYACFTRGSAADGARRSR
jgi:hypothetical protein